MWESLISADQLSNESRLRIFILEGNFRYETIYLVKRLGNYYFMAQIVEINGTQLEDNQQLIIPFRIIGIPQYGFEIWQ